MALAFLAPKATLTRPEIKPDGSWSYFGGDFQTFFVSGDKDHFTSRQIFKAGSKHTGAGRGSTATPPYHKHILQAETFHVNSGTLCYCIDGKLGKLEAGQSLVSKPMECHTFWSDPESGKDLDVNITVRGGDNPDGYLSSRTMEGKAPNPLQMLRFLDHADVILADIPFGLGRIVNIVFGRIIGGWIFGYPTSHKEFED